MSSSSNPRCSGTLGVISSRAILSSPSTGSYAPCGSCRTTVDVQYGVLRGLHFQQSACHGRSWCARCPGPRAGRPVDIAAARPRSGGTSPWSSRGQTNGSSSCRGASPHGFSVLSDGGCIPIQVRQPLCPRSEAPSRGRPALGIDWHLARGCRPRPRTVATAAEEAAERIRL